MADRLTTDTLFLACTRPALWFGVPHEAAVLNVMAGTLVLILIKNPVYPIAVCAALHFTARNLIAFDYNLFSVLRLWMNTKGRALNKDRWGGSSVSPLPNRPAKHAREVRIYV